MKSFLALLAALSFNNLANSYPLAPQVNNTEIRFGELIQDEYKWMENLHDPRLWDWILQEQNYTFSHLDLNWANYFANEIKKFNDIEAAQRSQEILATLGLAANPYIPLDPFNNEENVLGQTPTQKYTQKMTSIYGGDLSMLQIFETATMKLVDTLIVKFAAVYSISDKHLLYSSDGDGATGEGTTSLYYHTIGSNQGDDMVLYRAQKSDSSFGLDIVGNKIFIIESNSYTRKSEIMEFELSTQKVLSKKDFPGQKLALMGDKKSYLVLDNINYNNGAVFKYNIETEDLEPLIKEQSFNIERAVELTDNLFLVTAHEDAEAKAYIFNVLDDSLEQIPLPTGGRLSPAGLDVVKNESGVTKAVIKFNFTSFSQAKQTFEYDVLAKTIVLKLEHTFPIELVAKKLKYPAATGQDAAMWVVHKKGIDLNDRTPMLLYGYGGFDITMLPSFNFFKNLVWLDKGGAFTLVSLPGSLTYGRAWNEAASKGKRYISWDSFAAAGEELINLGLTSSDHLGMVGGSNGGLLVSGTLMRHPKLFKAAVPMVGVHDLLQFSLHTAGKYWTWEFGDPLLENDFKEVYPISPYQNLRAMEYPAVMVTTAEFDDRVSAWHSYKYAARLQQMQTGNAPIFLYNGEWAGHSTRSGSETNQLRLLASVYAFFAEQLGLQQ